ncbi:sugar-phosphatase [Paraclostridium bifermentans]|uniref:sugar-phosphatase n=1 Tax=Paraclostridium bifermentans TaxID=1490 RepID=UPI001FF4C7C5|nr:sugar-phosphatase [Paraclostridium bifermentans]UOW67279.1 sugar-phosphatase [Paraclostridium bifermentans]
MYKLIALDIDGTLLNSEKKVTQEVFDAIQNAKEKGVKVVLSTGRPLPGVQTLLKELKLNDEENYVVTFNGGLVQEITSQDVISNIEMSHEDFDYIYNELAKKHDIKIHINTPDFLVVPYTEVPKYSVHESTLNNIPVICMNENEINSDLTFCKVMLVDEPEIIEDIITKIPQEFHDKYTIVRSAPFFLEFLNKKVNKGSGLQALCDKLGIDPSEVIAVGDEENDRHMIEFAGLGVAMGNARDSIKEIANHITETNNNHGVAKVISDFIL